MKLIDKPALVAEIERLVNNQDSALDYEAALEDVRNFLDTIEVKEVQEEPVSEGLEDAANFYADTHTEWFDADNNPHVSPAFKAGAEWQKKQDQSTIELAEDHAMLAGMEKMKEEMMKNAVDAVVETDANGLSCVNVDGVDVGDKVKVIVIKDE